MLFTKYTKLSASYRIVLTCFLLCLPSFFTLAENSGAQQSARELIQQNVNAYVMSQVLKTDNQSDAENIRVNVRQLDDRINIPQCSRPFDLSSNMEGSVQTNLAVKVSCADNNWYLFVHANVSIVQKVVVSSDSLSPGSLLSAANLRIIEVDKTRLRGSTFSNIEDISGARIKRRVRAGNVIDGNMLCFICKGDRVTIAAVSGGLSVRVYGVAEQDGVLGDTIQVRNISSDKLVFARIASTSQVEINI